MMIVVYSVNIHYDDEHENHRDILLEDFSVRWSHELVHDHDENEHMLNENDMRHEHDIRDMLEDMIQDLYHDDDDEHEVRDAQRVDLIMTLYDIDEHDEIEFLTISSDVRCGLALDDDDEYDNDVQIGRDDADEIDDDEIDDEHEQRRHLQQHIEVDDDDDDDLQKLQDEHDANEYYE